MTTNCDEMYIKSIANQFIDEYLIWAIPEDYDDMYDGDDGYDEEDRYDNNDPIEKDIDEDMGPIVKKFNETIGVEILCISIISRDGTGEIQIHLPDFEAICTVTVNDGEYCIEPHENALDENGDYLPEVKEIFGDKDVDECNFDEIITKIVKHVNGC